MCKVLTFKLSCFECEEFFDHDMMTRRMNKKEQTRNLCPFCIEGYDFMIKMFKDEGVE